MPGLAASAACPDKISPWLTLAPLAVEAEHAHAFITHFLAHWRDAKTAKRARGRERQALQAVRRAG